MIDPKVLTEENGFVEGCVVEIVTEEERAIGTFTHVNFVNSSGPYLELENYTLSNYGFYGTRIEEIVSIHPLTGPMAIWNFAPEWADVCYHNDMGTVNFYSNEMLEQYGDMVFDTEHDTESKRPFWATKETK